MTICCLLPPHPLLPGVGEEGEGRALLLRRRFRISFMQLQWPLWPAHSPAAKTKHRLASSTSEQLRTGFCRLLELGRWVAELQ